MAGSSSKLTALAFGEDHLRAAGGFRLPNLRQHWVRSRTICRKWLAGLRRWAAQLKRDVVVLYSAACDPRVPWYAKVVALCVVAYAASPIDLIPDFVPILGYLDDLVILPLGIALAVRLIPADVFAEHRAAAERTKGLPRGWAAAVVIIGIWTLAIVLCIRWLATWLRE